jgi:NADH:ubiquinone oxidoreductase subunit
VAEDKYGNKYYENEEEELPRMSRICLSWSKARYRKVMATDDTIVRTRWVDYKDHEFDASHIEPGW